MANARQEEKSTQNLEDAGRRAGERTAEQASRIGQAAADQTARVGQAAAEAGEQVARASANLLKQNAETLQNTWRLGLEAASSAVGRSTEQFGRTLGLSGDGAQASNGARDAQRANAALHWHRCCPRYQRNVWRVLPDGSTSSREEHGPHERAVDLPNSSRLCSRSK